MKVSDLKDVREGSRINFEGERMPYTVLARDERFIIAIKPFAAQHTYLYTIIDLKRLERGPDNLVFGRSGGYGSMSEAHGALRELNDPTHPLEVSRKRAVSLRVARIREPKP
ncbi:hypothetical protein [Paraburkholderia bannensis]|uniref:hypothetical protein n=1 Tax=Paraburkholderia bannensis TaxID=765414 RepID=UPI002ABD6399|nr:hypothetical protein [Paraburkholderia bannensis]